MLFLLQGNGMLVWKNLAHLIAVFYFNDGVFLGIFCNGAVLIFKTNINC